MFIYTHSISSNAEIRNLSQGITNNLYIEELIYLQRTPEKI